MIDPDIDRAVWDAHLRPDLRLAGVDSANLDEWAKDLAQEARGYWHGMTGRLFERLGLGQAAWDALVQLHGTGAACLADSSLDLVPEILRRGARASRREVEAAGQGRLREWAAGDEAQLGLFG